MFHRRSILILLLALSLSWSPFAEAKTVIRMATLAPPGSSWMKVFRKIAKELKAKTNGEVEMKIYPGGRQGDEKDVVRKIRSGQLHMAAVTAVGLSEIQKEVLVLQLPLLFRKYSELDYVRNKLKPELEKKFLDKGFKLLSWGDVGFIYLMSNNPIVHIADLKKAKMWAWIDDPIGLTITRIANITPKTLSLPDVLPSLKTNLIDAVYVSPLAAIALQWYTKLKYISSMPLSVGIGATVISAKAWNAMPEAHKKALLEAQEKWHLVLIRKVRRDNKRSLKLLLENGLQVAQVTDEAKKEWRQLAHKVERALSGKIYPASLLMKVKQLIKDYRAGKR
ncbi:MAG: TRAP transporter substrate-binding protein DctP [Myxococcales bacterium]|nr:TRAP transporter substrate-binding protein DctP [Myxococcales bacterium]